MIKNYFCNVSQPSATQIMLRSFRSVATLANRRLYSLISHSNRKNIIKNLLIHPSFDPIRRHLPENIATFDPYSLSQNVIENLNKLEVPKEYAAVMHNLMIENLSDLDYSIATIHSNNLRELDIKPSLSAIKQIIKNNPGRVQSSWELFIQYKASIENVPDELIEVVLDKIIKFDKAEKVDGKKSLTHQDLVRCLYLIEHFSSSYIVSPNLIESILIYAIDNGIPDVLTSVLNYKIPLNFFDKYANEMTPYQIYEIYNYYSLNNIIADPIVLHRCVAVLGEKDMIQLTEEEKEIIGKMEEEIEMVKLQCHDNWSFKFPEKNARKTETAFRKLFLEIQEKNADKKDLKLALKLLRITGAFKGRISLFFELYHEYLLKFENNEDDLMFEAFLTLCCEGYRTGNEKMLQYSEAFIKDNIDGKLKSKAQSVLVVANARTNIDLSLKIYNSNIPKAKRDKDASTDIAESDVLTESLILAFLSKDDADFARVIFDGALGEKVISGPTAAKRIKKLLLQYGEALEVKKSREVMQSKIVHYMENV